MIEVRIENGDDFEYKDMITYFSWSFFIKFAIYYKFIVYSQVLKY